MKVLIAGSRHINDYALLDRLCKESDFEITEVLSGMARGVDMLGVRWAKTNGLPIMEFPADWEAYGKSAGYIRNGEMAEEAQAAIIIWDGVSRGTKHMLSLLKNRGIPFELHIV